MSHSSDHNGWFKDDSIIQIWASRSQFWCFYWPSFPPGMVSSGDVSLLLPQPSREILLQSGANVTRDPHAHNVIWVPPLSGLDFQVLEPINPVPPFFFFLNQVDLGFWHLESRESWVMNLTLLGWSEWKRHPGCEGVWKPCPSRSS